MTGPGEYRGRRLVCTFAIRLACGCWCLGGWLDPSMECPYGRQLEESWQRTKALLYGEERL